MNPDQTINLNQNAADCIKSATHFGHTTYTNICNGVVSQVSWGGVDWMLCIGLTALALLILGFLLAFILMMLSDL
jgi:hypothetical protein